jgi:hypothetical protein
MVIGRRMPPILRLHRVIGAIMAQQAVVNELGVFIQELSPGQATSSLGQSSQVMVNHTTP